MTLLYLTGASITALSESTARGKYLVESKPEVVLRQQAPRSEWDGYG